MTEGSTPEDGELLDAISEIIRGADRQLELLRAAIEYVPHPITLVDERGGLVAMNRAARETAGGDFDLGASVSDWEPVYHREDGSPYPNEELPLARSLRDGVHLHNEIVVAEWTPGRLVRLVVESMPIYGEGGGELLGGLAHWPVDEEEA